MALLLAGYLGQQYLPPPKPKVVGIDLGKAVNNFIELLILWCTKFIITNVRLNREYVLAKQLQQLFHTFTPPLSEFGRADIIISYYVEASVR